VGFNILAFLHESQACVNKHLRKTRTPKLFFSRILAATLMLPGSAPDQSCAERAAGHALPSALTHPLVNLKLTARVHLSQKKRAERDRPG
jgi:hypothetical protein